MLGRSGQQTDRGARRRGGEDGASPRERARSLGLARRARRNGAHRIPLYELLESRGFAVHLVNAPQVKNVSGRKSDVPDCGYSS